MRARLALAAALVSACSQVAPAPPALESVHPDQASVESGCELAITGAFLPLVRSDFTEPSGSSVDVRFRAWLRRSNGEELELAPVVYESDTRLRAKVPPGLLPGAYDLVIASPDGQHARLPNALRAVTGEESVAGFLLGPIGPQRVGVPFRVLAVAVDLQGRRVEGFDQTVALDDWANTVSLISAPFVHGRGLFEVTVTRAAPNDVLMIEDALGHRGYSEPFAVLPDHPVALSAQLPSYVDAGQCIGPLTLELHDRAGLSADAPDALVQLFSDPPVAQTFSDAGCATPITSARLDPATARAWLFLRVDRVGSVRLRLQPNVVPSLIHDLRVVPGPPRQLAFVDAPLRLAVDACVPLRLEVLDASGNPTSLLTGIQLSLETDPDAGIGFFRDASCTDAVGTWTLNPEEHGFTCFVSGTDLGAVRFRAATAVTTGEILPAVHSAEVVAP